MAISLILLRLCAVVAAVLLGIARGAPLVSKVKGDNPLVRPSTKNTNDGLLATFLNTVRSARASRALPEIEDSDSKTILVKMDKKTATKLNKKMTMMMELVKTDVEKRSFTCGKVMIEKKDLGTNFIPSYYYNVQCPKICLGDDGGNRQFRSVEMDTIFFKKLDSGVKNQYEVKSRRQIVGCCLEEDEDVADLFTHGQSPANPE